MKQAFGIDIPQTLGDMCNAKLMALVIVALAPGHGGGYVHQMEWRRRAGPTPECMRASTI